MEREQREEFEEESNKHLLIYTLPASAGPCPPPVREKTASARRLRQLVAARRAP
jgi:hypothetical protein